MSDPATKSASVAQEIFTLNLLKDAQRSPSVVKVQNKDYLVVYDRSELLNTSLLVYIPEDQLVGSIHKNHTWFWILTGIYAVVIVLLWHLFINS
jgi:hypothetical protein